MQLKLNMTRNLILIERQWKSPETVALHLPDGSETRTYGATVIDVGPDVEEQLYQGDQIYLDRFSGQLLAQGDHRSFYIVKPPEIILVETTDGVEPFGDYSTIVFRCKTHTEVQTDGGTIFMPECAAEKPPEAEVLLDRSGERLPEGTRIIMSEYAGYDIEVKNQEYTVLKPEHLLAVLE